VATVKSCQGLPVAAAAERLDHVIEEIINDRQTNESAGADPVAVDELANRAAPLLDRAFRQRDPAALHEVHRTLFLLYDQAQSAPDSAAARKQFDPALLRLRGAIEQAWEQVELQRVPLTPADLPTGAKQFTAFLEERTFTHPVMSQPLFDYLQDTASREQLISFFVSDSLLNVRFFDLLSLGLFGSRGTAKIELMRNMWDEVGRGDADWVHTDLFRRVLDYVEVPFHEPQLIAGLSWQGLAGFNLYYFMGMHRRYHFRYIGNMAATEMLDPPLYDKLLGGCRRVGIYDEVKLRFYVDHLTTDVAHGQGWLDNVIAPYVIANPTAAWEIYAGLEMRLNTCQDYHEYVYATLTGNTPAVPAMAAADTVAVAPRRQS
jgi:hypothetical protein